MQLGRLLSLISFLVWALACLGALLCWEARAQDSEATLIDKPIAEYAASTYLPKYYPGDWVVFCDLTYYDLDGKPAAYAFVFKRAGTVMANPDSLQGEISEALAKRKGLETEISALESSPSLGEAAKAEMAGLRAARKVANKALYRTEEFATVLTGAWDTAPPVYACEPGIPPVLAEKPGLDENIKALKAGSGLALGRVLFLNPYDIRYEVVPSEQAKLLTAAKVSGQAVPPGDEALTVSWDKKEPEKVSVLRAGKLKARLEKAHQLQMMEDSERSKYQEGIEQRKRSNAQEWQEFQKRARAK